MTTAGYIAPRFGAIGELFDEVVSSQPAGGAAFSVFVDGECVVDVYGGEARPGVAWDDTTLSLIFSNTKGLISVAAATLVESGVLNPDAAVSDYWPEFAVVSGDLTVRGLFEHRAGLSAVRRDMTLAEVFDHDAVIRALLTQEPLWGPGTGYAYHAITFGNLVDELVRHVDGRTVSRLFQDAVVAPLGVEAWIGTPADQLPRVAEFVEADWPLAPPPPHGSAEDLQARAMSLGAAFPSGAGIHPGVGFNNPRVHAAEMPGVNAITNARGLAAMWSATVAPTNGVRVLSDDTVDFLRERRVAGPSVWGEPGPWPERGFGVMLECEARFPLLSSTSFGHDGFGGQAGFADVAHRASFGFVTNYLIVGRNEHARWKSLVHEVRTILQKD